MTKVLVIEDDEAVVSFLSDYLGDEGFTVQVADDGLEGLLKLKTIQPDIAIVDIMMPDVDGVRVLEQMLEEGNGQLPVPVVVVTGSPEGAEKCRELLDPRDVIEKPFDPDHLLERLRAHVD